MKIIWHSHHITLFYMLCFVWRGILPHLQKECMVNSEHEIKADDSEEPQNAMTILCLK